MNHHPGKRLLALLCAIICLLALSGCDAAKSALEYIDNYVPPTAPETTVTTPPAPTDPMAPTTEPAATTAPPVKVGVVSGASTLNIRKGAGLEFDVVGSLDEGTKVAIYEQVQVGDKTWGRIKAGWISMEYIKLQNEVNEEITTTHSIIATVTGEYLNIRSGPSVNYRAVGGLYAGDKVQITELCIVGKTMWGKSIKGWVCMDYIKIDGTPNGELRLSGTVNANPLTIRSGPGADKDAIGSYVYGDKVMITQLEAVGYVAWGKTDKGWICMSYVAPDGNITVSATP